MVKSYSLPKVMAYRLSLREKKFVTNIENIKVIKLIIDGVK